MREYVIKGMPYKNASGGTRALYIFRDELRRRGFKAEVDAEQDLQDDEKIVVWCDALVSNPNLFPLKRTKRMVGWKLGDFGTFDRQYFDLVFYYADFFLDNVADRGNKLAVPIIERDLFNTDGCLAERSYSCFWCGKGDPEVSRKWLVEHQGIREITYKSPETREELAKILKGCDILYTADCNSALLEEARLCGSIVCYIPNAGHLAPNRPEYLDAGFGIAGYALRDSTWDIQRARQTLFAFAGRYDTIISTWHWDIENFIKKTQEKMA